MLVFNKYFYKKKKLKLYFVDRVAVLNDFIYQTGGSTVFLCMEEKKSTSSIQPMPSFGLRRHTSAGGGEPDVLACTSMKLGRPWEDLKLHQRLSPVRTDSGALPYQ
jgi:hypothetical protein